MPSETHHHEISNEEVILIVHAQDGQYHLRTGSDINEWWPDSPDGLLTGETEWIAVLCGIEFGPVEITLQLHEQPPPLDTEHWEMAVERTLNCPDREMTIVEIYSGNAHNIPIPANLLRLRVSVRNRTTAAPLTIPPQEPVEDHRIDIWPTTNQEPTYIVHGPDEHAQHLI